jgi:adenosylhomocysteine nucleosidase
MTETVEIGIVAAMQREISPLIAKWQPEVVTAGKQFKFFRKGSTAVAICSGPTKANAAASTKVLVERYTPRVILSVGFAGSLRSDVSVPELVIPETVVDVSSGVRAETLGGRGTVVTVDRVVGRLEKAELASRWSAVAVDMEAAGVAAVARQHGIDFAAMKVISDEASAEMDFISKFVTPEGFRTAAFLAYIAIRPSLWPVVKHLQKNAVRATSTLSNALERMLEHPERFCETLRASANEQIETRA